MTQYFHLLKNIWQEFHLLDSYEWKSTNVRKHYRKIVQNNRIYKFLAGLNVEFYEVRGRILGKITLPSINDVFSEVYKEESCKNVIIEKKPIDSVESSTLVTKQTAMKPLIIPTRHMKSLKSDVAIAINPDIHMKHVESFMENLQIGKVLNKGKNSHLHTSNANVGDSNLFNKEKIDQILKPLKTTSPSGNPSVSLAQSGNFPQSLA